MSHRPNAPHPILWGEDGPRWSGAHDPDGLDLPIDAFADGRPDRRARRGAHRPADDSARHGAGRCALLHIVATGRK
jgi:hypothetical protein